MTPADAVIVVLALLVMATPVRQLFSMRTKRPYSKPV